MKQFFKVFKFELKNYFTNKIFVGTTIFFMVLSLIIMSLPRVIGLFKQDDEPAQIENPPVMVLAGEDASFVENLFISAFPNYKIIVENEVIDKIRHDIIEERVKCAVVLDGLTSYKYYVNNLSMLDMNTQTINEVLKTAYMLSEMEKQGVSSNDAINIISQPITFETTALGANQINSFFYVYIMIFALYVVILLYGQMIASSVASEKSSRAMEVLITSVKPTALMFGKVLSSCIAGLIQLIAIFGSTLLFYNINKEAWGGNEIINSIFNMSFELILYMLLFFVLGFLIYSFLFGAVGSTASKLEDINTSCMPLILLFVAGFIIVMISMATGSVDSVLMKICSYVPFTSPMAMFTRIAMSTVKVYEIIISITLLIVSVLGTGYVSAKIYRFGVLHYGNPPKIKDFIKTLLNSK